MSTLEAATTALRDLEVLLRTTPELATWLIRTKITTDEPSSQLRGGTCSLG